MKYRYLRAIRYFIEMDFKKLREKVRLIWALAYSTIFAIWFLEVTPVGNSTILKFLK